jgi:hypothetical protein
MSSVVSDGALLRRFEPMLRFTRGERFFPMAVDCYVKACSLWVQRPNQPPHELVPAGQLTLDHLAIPYSDEFGAVRYLKLTEQRSLVEIAADLSGASASGRWRRKVLRNRHGAGQDDHTETYPDLNLNDRFVVERGRLARVGYGSRLIDALFSVSLLARGRVPGEAAIAAEKIYRRFQEQGEPLRYYGRVVRQNSWIVLQYWYFYVFNDWRSRFFGANDHESDWEMISVYLTGDETTGELQPVWVAYASHDYQGDDLRRRWDDPELIKVGEHPVAYVAAGSHATYFHPGEYLTEIELSFLSPAARILGRLQRFWRYRLRQYSASDQPLQSIFRVPFVDYARGDGLSIGQGGVKTWHEPFLLNSPPWVSHYRGLWGLYTRDPFAGEDAPAGPMYNRDGSVRRAWYDPLGWAGLDKVTPPDVTLQWVLREQGDLQIEQRHLDARIRTGSNDLQRLGVRAAAMRGQPHLQQLYNEYQEKIEALSEEVDGLRSQRAANGALLEALTVEAERLRSGLSGSARNHIQRGHKPASDEELRMGRLAELWAAVSVGLMMVIVVTLFYFARQYLVFGLVAVISLFAFIEASVRGHLTRLISSITVGLSIVAAMIIVYEFFWMIVVIVVLIMGGYILWDNLQELRR